MKPCSAETSADCQARKRLPEEFFATTARETAATLDKSVKPEWLWKQRRVLIYDGSTVSMTDTPKNQRAYPQPLQQPRSLQGPPRAVHGAGDPRPRPAAADGILRCKTPELVRKEIWTHVLACRLIRTTMAQAASGNGLVPRTISFKGAVQALEAFQPSIALLSHRGAVFRQTLYDRPLGVVLAGMSLAGDAADLSRRS